jgi:NTE family protein
VKELEGAVDLRVIPPPCPLEVSPADFSHARELIPDSRDRAGRWLDDTAANESVHQSGNLLHPH